MGLKIDSILMRISFGAAPSAEPLVLLGYVKGWLNAKGLRALNWDPKKGVCVGKKDVYIEVEVTEA